LKGKSSINRLINQFEKLPGIGRKTAERLAFYLVKSDEELARALAEAILEVKRSISFCKQCFNFSEGELCEICADPSRDRSKICVVEEPKDIWTIERSGTYRGLYHVLMGAISPLDGIGPEDLKIKELLNRIQKGGIDEIIVATDPNIEGDATALYLAKLIKPLGIKITRLASGLPVGGDLEYADSVTVAKALSARQPL